MAITMYSGFVPVCPQLRGGLKTVLRADQLDGSQFSSKLLHPRGRPHMHAKPP